jgi:hypothetical protein
MNEHELHAALGDLAGRGADEQAARLRAATGLSAERVVAVAGRRRRVRVAAAGGSALAVVAALVLGGAALAERPEPLPAAPGPTRTPSPTPSPSPSPTPTASAPATALPAGDPAAPFGTCGSLLASAPPRDDRWVVAGGPRAERVDVGEPLPVSAMVQGALSVNWEPTGANVGLLEDSGPEVLVLRDGVVVAGGDLYGDVPAGYGSYYAEAGIHAVYFAGTLPLTSCQDGGDLPPGDYQVVTSALALPLGDDAAVLDTPLEVLAAQHEADWVRVVGDPEPFSVVASGAPATTPPAPVLDAALVPEPACGAAPVVSDTGRTLTLDAPPPTSTGPGAVVSAPGVLTYLGPDRLRAHLRLGVQYLMERDGVVVGGSRLHYDGYWGFVDLGTGATLPVPEETDLVACEGEFLGEQPLPPGTYTVHPVLPMTAAEIRSPGGTVDLTGGQQLVVRGEPFPLVVE